MVPPKAIAPDIWANNSDTVLGPKGGCQASSHPNHAQSIAKTCVPWVESPARHQRSKGQSPGT